mgnify:CR=1 FL=1
MIIFFTIFITVTNVIVISIENIVCLLNINTNNGYTEFDKGYKTSSKENSAIIFDGDIRHRSVTQTDVKCRVNININYYE